MTRPLIVGRPSWHDGSPRGTFALAVAEALPKASPAGGSATQTAAENSAARIVAVKRLIMRCPRLPCRHWTDGRPPAEVHRGIRSSTRSRAGIEAYTSVYFPAVGRRDPMQFMLLHDPRPLGRVATRRRRPWLKAFQAAAAAGLESPSPSCDARVSGEAPPLAVRQVKVARSMQMSSGHRWVAAIKRWAAKFAAVAVLATCAFGATAQPRFDLVTAEEAQRARATTAQALPPAALPEPKARDTRGVRRADAPTIRVVAPADTQQTLRPPLRIELTFVPSTGAQIVPATFRVLYGLIRIDLTERLRRHATITPAGAVIDHAMVPEGTHRFFLQVGDDKGAVGEHEVQVRVGAPADDDSPRPRVAPLLALVLQGVASEALRESVAGDQGGGLFDRLRKRLQGSADVPAAAAPAASAALGDATASPQPAVVPALGYAIDLLDPDSFAPRQAVVLDAQQAPVLHTGDVIAIRFSTNVPGIVRLENIGPGGQVTGLGTYRVRAEQLNRIPRERGIRLEGDPGIERIRFYFQPCRHDDLRPGDAPPDAAGLRPCNAAAVAALERAAHGEISARVLVNLDQPDPTLVFAGTAEYRADEVTVLEARIRHEPSR